MPPKPGEPGIGHSIPVPADHSDQGILDRLRSHHEYRVRTNQIDAEPHPLRAMYGSHWTSDPSLAHRFAFDQTHGQYRVPPVPTRATTGVVLEMQSKVPPERDRLSSQFGETEVKWPGREHVERVLAHVHRYDPAVHGEGPMNFHRADTYVRSFEIPQEHLKKHAGKERVKVYRGLYLADEPETYEGEVRRRFDHREPVGSHWSTDPDVAKSFALDYMHGAGGAGMVLHGEVDAEHVVDRSEIHRDRGVMSPNHFEREHYVRPGAPIDVHQTSVHWHHPEEYDEETGTSKDDFEDEAHEKHDPPLRVHANSTDDIMDLLGPPVKPAAPPEPDADEKHQQRIADHKAWQDSRPGLNPGDDISKHQMGKEYPTAEWVPIEVAQRFRDHRGDQHAGSEETVHDIHRQLESGRGMTDPLMLLHHNEDQRAHLGEGNHRLVAAERAGWTHVPMRVVRMYDSESEAGKGQLIPSRWRNREYRGRTPEMAKPSEVFHPDLFKHDRMTKQGIALEWEVIQRDARTRILDSGPDGQEATGIMVAIVPPKRVAKSLEIEDGEPHEQLHVTLAFLGDTSDYTDDQLFDLPEVVAAWAETQPQTLAKTQGAGTFTPHTEGGKHVLWAAVEIPGVHRMHQSLIEHLKAHGYKPKEDFEYQPHLTLAYSKYHWRFIPKVTRQEWKVREVWLAVGGKWETHRLGS